MLKCINNAMWEKKNGYYIEKNLFIRTSFNDLQQDKLFALEDNSWWFQYRAEVILELMDCFFDKKREVLDIGGGNGYTTKKVAEAGYLAALMEPSPQACVNAQSRGGVKGIYCGTIDEYSVKDKSIDQCMLLDVLEHIEDDCAFLKLLHRKLIPQGRCLITVPAFMSLWSSEDEEAGHFRRYRRREIERLAAGCGFEVVYSSYFMSFLYLPILFFRVGLEKAGILKKQNLRTPEEKARIAKAQFEVKEGLVDSVLRIFENAEISKIKKKSGVRFGSSIIMILKNREIDSER